MFTHPSLNIIDSSKMQTYMACPRKFFYTYCCGFSADKNVHLTFGIAMHKLMESLYLHGYNAKGVEEGYQNFLTEYRKVYSEESDLHNAPKNPAMGLIAAVQYTEKYRRDNFDVFGTEIGFKLDIDGNFIYGKIDAIIKPEEGYTINELKTTGWSLEGTWAAQWTLRTQCNVYLLALHTYLAQCGISAKEINGLRIDGILLKQLKAGPKVDFKRVMVKKSQQQLKQFGLELSVWLDKIVTATYNIKQGQDPIINFPKTTSDVNCFSWNRQCEFYSICVTDGDIMHVAEKNPAQFEVNFWDPRDQTDEVKDLT